MSMVNNKDFDERQILARGKGFQIGFLLSLAVILLNFVTEIEGFPININTYSKTMLSIWIPIVTVSIYFIVKDAYEGLSVTGGNISMVILSLFGVLEIVLTFVKIAMGDMTLIESGIIGDALGQLVVGLSSLLIGTTYYVKKHLDKKKLSEEE